MRKHLNTPQIPSLTPSHLDLTLRFHSNSSLFAGWFTWCLKSCLYHVWTHVYTMFEIMFKPYLKSCLCMFTPYLKSCLYNVWQYVYTIYEVMLTRCLKSCFCHVWTHAYTIFGFLFKPCLISCLQCVREHVYNIFEEMFKDLFYLYLHEYFNLVWLTCLYLHYVWRNVYSLFGVLTLSKHMLSLCFILGHFYTIFEDKCIPFL